MSADDQRNAPWSRGECPQCGQDVLLARAYPTYGPQLCEACEVHERADADWQKRVREVVAELRELSAIEKSKCSDQNYERHHSAVPAAYSKAADLVAEKLRVK